MAQHLRIANAEPQQRVIGDWADTDTSQDIRRSLDLVWASNGPSLTMISGAPGIGKTKTVRKFCEDLNGKAIYIQAARGEGTPWNFANSLANLWPYARPTYNSQSEAREQLARWIGKDYLLVVDEAQYLYQKNRKTGQTGEAFEWLRATAETGGFSVVLCGDLNLPQAVQTMPQLQSRMIRPVVIHEVSRSDIAAITNGTAFSDSRSIDALHAVARMRGGLRNVENVTRIAMLFAGEEQPSHEHLKAAIVDMKLDSKARKF